MTIIHVTADRLTINRITASHMEAARTCKVSIFRQRPRLYLLQIRFCPLSYTILVTHFDYFYSLKRAGYNACVTRSQPSDALYRAPSTLRFAGTSS